jgi:hypothetical protein
MKIRAYEGSADPDVIQAAKDLVASTTAQVERLAPEGFKNNLGYPLMTVMVQVLLTVIGIEARHEPTDCIAGLGGGVAALLKDATEDVQAAALAHVIDGFGKVIDAAKEMPSSESPTIQ